MEERKVTNANQKAIQSLLLDINEELRIMNINVKKWVDQGKVLNNDIKDLGDLSSFCTVIESQISNLLKPR